MAQLSVPVRIRSSSSSTSSLSSTFSDLAASTSTTSSSPPNSKTNAFFASPFNTRPPSPTPVPVQKTQSDKPRSITADFFATSVRPPSPPASARAFSPPISSIPASSIFPSRYTSSLSSPRHNRDFITLTDEPAPHTYHPSAAYHSRTSSQDSDELPALFASPTSPTFGVPRLPTPPPTFQRGQTVVLVDKDRDMRDEPTPRPAPREPMLKFERSLLFARQGEEQEIHRANEQEDLEEVEADREELKEGSIICIPATVSQLSAGNNLSPPVRVAPLPISPLALAFTLGPEDPVSNDRGTPTPTPVDDALPSEMNSSSSHKSMTLEQPLPAASSPRSISRSSSSQQSSRSHIPSHIPTSQLRLVRPLGHGAFSSVWLAEDLSRVPLALVSKKSVRDLRRKASGRERDKQSDRQRDLERDNEWRLLNERKQERARTPNTIEHKREPGDLDDTPRPPASLPSSVVLSVLTSEAKESPKRQASRLREGLRSMLAFSRGSTHNNVITTPNPVPPFLGVDIDTSVATPIENEPSPLSSGSSVHSADFALSRASSLRSSAVGVPDSPSLSSSIGIHRAPSIRGETSDTDKTAALLRDASLRKFRSRVRGTRPAIASASGRYCLDERDGEMGVEHISSHLSTNKLEGRLEGHSDSEYDSEREVLQSSLARKPSSNAGRSGARTPNRLVAVKMTARRSVNMGLGGAKASGSGKGDMRQRERDRMRVKARREEDERTRVRFVREVEVLKHISHPNITPLLAHLSTETQHILVLPYLPGGDLLGLVNSDVSWGKLTESVLRRIWMELCKAVGWMHGVGLVHRDIKLENILMTAPIFSSLEPSSPAPTISSLPALPAPFIKLTDFGLSRFVELKPDGEAELLSTRCGSEAYAAPELVTGGGVYDARKTDAWACGVVLYALVGRVLPFGEGSVKKGAGSRIGGERGEEIRQATPVERRQWLMRIAKGEWHWPQEENGEIRPPVSAVYDNRTEELVGVGLIKSRGARRIVNRLLVRDTRKRARIADLWDDSWMSENALTLDAEMNGPGGQKDDHQAGNVDDKMAVDDGNHDRAGGNSVMDETSPWDGDAPEFWKDTLDVTFYSEPTWIEGSSDEHGEGVSLDYEEDGEDQDGCLLDQDGIDSITRQEVV